MSGDSGIEVELDKEGVFTLTLNRAAKMNALTMDMCDELKDHFKACSADPAVRVVLVQAAGRAFSAGRDLSDAQPGEDSEAILNDRVNPMIEALYECPKPTISVVNGPAMGIGLGVALACDIVVGSENALFSSPFAKLGAALDSGGHYFLPRRIGTGRALSMIYTSELIRGAKAYEIGLLDKLVPADVLKKGARKLADDIAAGPTISLQEQKAVLRKGLTADLSAVLKDEARAQGKLAQTAESAEGLAAYNEKRPANFRAIKGDA